MKPLVIVPKFEDLRRLFALARCHLWFVPAMAALGLLTSLFEGFSLALVAPLVQTLGNGGMSEATGWLISSLQMIVAVIPIESRLFAVIAAIFVAVLLKSVVSYANMVVLGIVYGRLSHTLRTSIFEKIIAMPLAKVERERSGRLLNVLNNETWRATDALNTLFTIITSLATLVVFVLLLLFLSWRLTLLALFCVTVIPPLIHALTRRVKRLSDIGLEANQELAKRTWFALAGLRIIHAFGREDFEKRLFAESSDRVRDIFLRMALIAVTSAPLMEVLVTAIVALLVLLVDVTQVALPTLVAFLVILYRLQPRVMSLVNAHVQLQGMHATIREVSDILATTTKVSAGAGNLPFINLREEIQFDDVTFTYDEAKHHAVANATFRISRGGMVAIVGSSGAGKSTLLDLLLGFHEPQRGTILVDGIPLHNLDLASWRSRIGVVSQDTYIFDDTVKANILYGNLEASDEEVAAAARLACADEFIRELAQGYDTVVGDRGTQISGGQRQRLALVRALVREPDILILDEATNALDAETERTFQDALKNFARDRTVIIVAHRLTMLDKLDQVIVLDDGTIVEKGEPQALLRADGLFARMFRFQNPNPPTATADGGANEVGLADTPKTVGQSGFLPGQGGGRT